MAAARSDMYAPAEVLARLSQRFDVLAGPSPRVCRIKNTASLDEVWASEALLDEVKSNRNLEMLSPPSPLPFDKAGNLF